MLTCKYLRTKYRIMRIVSILRGINIIQNRLNIFEMLSNVENNENTYYNIEFWNLLNTLG